MNERLKKIRTSKNLTLAKFGESVGLSPGAVSDMERGRRGITDQTIRSICREYHVNEEWFKNGTGEMFMADSGDEIEALARRYNLSHGIQVFIEKLVNSNEAAQQAVIDLIVETAAAINGSEVAPEYHAPKSFEEMSPEEIADAVREGREAEKGEEGESSRSSYTA